MNKFLIFQHILSENSFNDKWKECLVCNEKMIISTTHANTLEKFQTIFPFSEIYENIYIEIMSNKDESPGTEKTLCGIFNIIFYPKFIYHYRIWFCSNYEIQMQIGYPNNDSSDPKQRFVGEILMDNFKNFLNPLD